MKDRSQCTLGIFREAGWPWELVSRAGTKGSGHLSHPFHNLFEDSWPLIMDRLAEVKFRPTDGENLVKVT